MTETPGDPTVKSEACSDQDPGGLASTLLQKIECLKAELADVRFELEGCRETGARLSAEVRRLRLRFRAISEGDLECP